MVLAIFISDGRCSDMFECIACVSVTAKSDQSADSPDLNSSKLS